MPTQDAGDRATNAAERRHAIDALREAGDHPLMYAFPHGAVFAFDNDLRYLSAGGLGLADVGLSREMIEGRTIFEVFPEETTRTIEPFYRAALAGTSTTWDVPYGGRIYAQHLAPITDRNGEVVAGLGFTLDSTEARAAEQSLRESEERNRLTFEHAPIGQAIVGLDGQWLQVNAALTSLTGYTESELLAMTFQDITHPDDLDLDLGHLNRLVAGEINSYQIEKRYFTASGRIVWVLLAVAMVRDDAGSPRYFISQVKDITQRKRQHQALKDLTGMLAHDLRNPASVIQGFAELLESSDGTDPHLVRAHAARIAGAARSMTDLLDNALTATHLDAGQVIASPTWVPVREAILRVLEGLSRGAVAIDVVGAEDVTVWMDPVHFTQVATNLMTNAIKYGGDALVVSTVTAQGRVALSFADNGPGVEPDFVPHLFDRFSRSTQVRRSSRRGSGLGLYIVRDLLTANGGTIEYAPGEAGGSVFTVDLPMSPRMVARADHGVSDGVTAPQPSAPPPRRSPPATSRR